MKLSLQSPNSLITQAGFWILLLNAIGLDAQTPIENVNESLEQTATETPFDLPEGIPLFFEDEFEDIGPQYLLRPGKKPHDWIRVVFDSQWLYTSNPTLASDENAQSTDLLVFTTQVGIAPRNWKWQGGEMSLLSGYRYQIFKYAALTEDELINGIEVSENNFEAHTVFSDLKWTKGAWTAQAGLRWTRLDNSDNANGFYQEVVPTWGISRAFNLTPSTLLTARYDGAFFMTKSEAFILQRDDFNDRVSQNISIGATHRIFDNFFFQPRARLNYSIFTDDPNGDREDLTWGLSGTFTYRWGSKASVRFFTAYQSRNSNGVGITDYDNLDIGWGANVSFRF